VVFQDEYDEWSWVGVERECVGKRVVGGVYVHREKRSKPAHDYWTLGSASGLGNSLFWVLRPDKVVKVVT
jgi:hypothetical protein